MFKHIGLFLAPDPAEFDDQFPELCRRAMRVNNI